MDMSRRRNSERCRSGRRVARSTSKSSPKAMVNEKRMWAASIHASRLTGAAPERAAHQAKRATSAAVAKRGKAGAAG